MLSTSEEMSTWFRRVTRGGRGAEVSPAPFQKLEKSAIICGKKCPDWGHLKVKFSFKMQFLRVSRWKNRRFFPCRAFLSDVYRSARISRNLPCPKKFLVTRLPRVTFVSSSSKTRQIFEALLEVCLINWYLVFFTYALVSLENYT